MIFSIEIKDIIDILSVALLLYYAYNLGALHQRNFCRVSNG